MSSVHGRLEQDGTPEDMMGKHTKLRTPRLATQAAGQTVQPAGKEEGSRLHSSLTCVYLLLAGDQPCECLCTTCYS